MAALFAMARHRSVLAAAFRASSFTMERSHASGKEAGNPQLGRMADDRLHLVALGQALDEQHGGPVRRVVEALRDARERQLVGEVDDLAFEVVARGVDDRDVLARRQPKHARVLRVVSRQAQRERRSRLAGEHLVFQVEMGQGHGSSESRRLYGTR